WLSQDPVGLRAGPNLYSYVDNKPTGAVDPLGLCTTNPTAGQMAGAVAAGVGVGLLGALVIAAGAAAVTVAFPMVAIALAGVSGWVWTSAGVILTAVGAYQAIQMARGGCTLQALFSLGMLLGGWFAGPILRAGLWNLFQRLAGSLIGPARMIPVRALTQT